MAADWEEIKRLAADLQKAQLSSTLQRLSERNCVEIVTKLIEQKLIDVIFTNDGKEYITPDQLVREMQSELFVHGGRINLTELSKILNVDFAQVSKHASDILKSKDVHLVLGQLIDDNYITHIAGEINERLLQAGKISVSDLTLQFDLPADFLLHNVIDKQLGKLIHGRQDPNDSKLIYTEAFAARSKAKIRGALAALTRPTPVTVILNHCELQEGTFFLLYDQIHAPGILTSRQTGAQYIPHVYSKSQADWVNNFYRQNRYLEFDALARLGIPDPKNYVKRQFPNEELVTLKSCIVSKSLIEQAEGSIDECISSKSYVDVATLLPSVFEDDDISLIIDGILVPNKRKQVLIFGVYILTIGYIDELMEPCNKLVQERANDAVENGTYQQFQAERVLQMRSGHTDSQENDIKVDKREERRRKATGGKGGGGTQGRETKTKSTKKHSRSSKTSGHNDSDDDNYSTKKNDQVLELISVKDIEVIIESRLEEEGISELCTKIAQNFQSDLNKKALDIAANLHAMKTQNSAANRRHTHAALQEKINAFLCDIRLFEKGAKLFPSDVQTQLYKYLLKSMCTDIVNEILIYIAAEYDLNTNNFSNPLTIEQRNKIVNEVPQEYKSNLQALVKSLSGQNIEEFLTHAEESLAACSMILKKIDKKKDRVLILNHKHCLSEQLSQCDNPALVLHLTSLILFITCTQHMLHASGKHVSAILTFLKTHLSDVDMKQLTTYYDLVTKFLSNDSNKESVAEELNAGMETIKNISVNVKKSVSIDK